MNDTSQAQALVAEWRAEAEGIQDRINEMVHQRRGASIRAMVYAKLARQLEKALAAVEAEAAEQAPRAQPDAHWIATSAVTPSDDRAVLGAFWVGAAWEYYVCYFDDPAWSVEAISEKHWHQPPTMWRDIVSPDAQPVEPAKPSGLVWLPAGGEKPPRDQDSGASVGVILCTPDEAEGWVRGFWDFVWCRWETDERTIVNPTHYALVDLPEADQ